MAYLIDHVQSSLIFLLFILKLCEYIPSFLIHSDHSLSVAYFYTSVLFGVLLRVGIASYHLVRQNYNGGISRWCKKFAVLV